MGDDSDRARLQGLTELEREEILADRRDARAKIQDRKRIIQMARDKKQREEGALKKKFKPSSAGTERKSSRVAGGEGEREKSKTSRALVDIAKKKKSQMASRRRADEEEDDAEDGDEDDGDDSDEYDDEDLEDEELDGILPTRDAKTAVRGGRAGAVRSQGGGGRATRRGGDLDDDDDDEDLSDEDDEEDGGGDRVPASELNIRKIILRREKLERWISEPFFADCAPGCYVRIGIGVSKNTRENAYRLAEIAEVAEGKHGHYTLNEYEYVPGSGKRTNRWLILSWGAAERAFRISEVSNSELQPKEFLEWQQQMAKDGRRGPLLRDVAAAEEQINRAESYRYTSEDVNKMVQEKNQSMGGLRHNLAGQKEILRRLIERAASEGDEAASAQLQEQLAQVMVKLNRKLDKGGTQGVMAAINKRNNQLNDANLSRIASENIARAKSGKPDDSMNDPFSRRPTRMATYYTIKRDGAGKEDGAAADAQEGEAGKKTPTGIKTSGGGGGGRGGGPKTPRTPKSGLGAFSVAAAAKLSALAKAHAVSLSGVDPALAARPDPVANLGIHPGLQPVLRRGLLGAGVSSSLLAGVNPTPPRGKSLTLEEYKVRQGIE